MMTIRCSPAYGQRQDRVNKSGSAGSLKMTTQ